MTDKPLGPKALPEDAIRAMKTLSITNSPEAPDLPYTLRVMRIAARAMLDEVNRLADAMPPFVALAPADIVRTTVKFIDADGLALRLFESHQHGEETDQ